MFFRKRKEENPAPAPEGRTAQRQPAPIKISSVEWRDGQQSLLATRIKTEDMLPILEKMDAVGYVWKCGAEQPSMWPSDIWGTTHGTE